MSNPPNKLEIIWSLKTTVSISTDKLQKSRLFQTTATFTRIRSKSKCNPNNGVFKQQRVGPVGQRTIPQSIGHETSPHHKIKQRPTASSDIVIRRTIWKRSEVRGTIHDHNVSMIVDTAAMITLVNEKLISAENGDLENVTLRSLG